MSTAQQIHDLIQAYAQGPQLLEAALGDIREEELRFTPGAEHWSIHENVIHLADTDLVYAARIRYLVAEPKKIPLSFDGFRWSRALGYSSQPLGGALSCFRATRTATAAFLAVLPAEVWEQKGLHWEQDRPGSEPRTLTVAQAVELFIDHVHYHLRSIARRRAQYAQAKRSP